MIAGILGFILSLLFIVFIVIVIPVLVATLFSTSIWEELEDKNIEIIVTEVEEDKRAN